MTEKLLQYIWQYQYFNGSDLVATSGDTIAVIYPGLLNANQGPDFLQAHIKIGDTTLIGSVELHIKTSDWQKHQHSLDVNYRNVILHVVYQNDAGLTVLPTVELESRISLHLLDRYAMLMALHPTLACYRSISQVDHLVWHSWKERLVVERLTRKTGRISSFLETNNFHWEEAFWWVLCRQFGSTVNADAFEALARSVPISILAKHRGQIQQIEALLLGQANLLRGRFKDDYAKLLQREYRHLVKKCKLSPIHVPVYFLRMRPGNFPTLRLAQLAMLIFQTEHLFSKIIEAQTIAEIRKLFRLTANDYWHYRYRFDEPSPHKKKSLGNTTIDALLINAVIPMIFAYGNYHSDERQKLKAIQWLEEVDAESNKITALFSAASLPNKSAFDSQAYLELKAQYCDPRRCLNCAVGGALLKME